MATPNRNKNALRAHFVAEYSQSTPTNWLPLAHWITSITDDSTDNTEEFADYAGDGTPQTDVLSISEAWTATGTYDSNNPAQVLIAGKKRETGLGRKLWHRIVESNGAREVVGVATATDIVAGSGDAEAYEEFSCTLTFDGRPTERTATPLVAPFAGGSKNA